MTPNGVKKTGQKVFRLELVLDITHWQIEWAIDLILRRGIKDETVTSDMIESEIKSQVEAHGLEFMAAHMRSNRKIRKEITSEYAERTEKIALRTCPQFYYL